MYANMASLNSWRQARGFSYVRPLTKPEHLILMEIIIIRHVRFSSSLWRSRRHRSFGVGVPDCSLDLAWHLASKSASTSVFILPETDRIGNESIEQ